MAQPEDKATVGTDLSAELGTKTKGGSLSVPSLLSLSTKLCFGMKAINPRGLGTESPDQRSRLEKITHTKQRRGDIFSSHPLLSVA
jgi:hypothetical protein